MLEIELLGGFRLLHQGRLLDGVKPGKPQLLLAYLVLHREQWLARARVACALWPDSSEDQARTNLRRELHGLRHALPEGYLHCDPRQLAWMGGPYRLDVAEFEAGRLECYRGEILPGYYPEWLLEVREQLARRYREGLEKQLTELENRGRWREACEAARALIALDPADEELHRRLIRLHLAEGNRPRAEQALRECSQRLRQELDVEVSQATRELLQAPEVKPAPKAPLFGRERELAGLRAAPQGHLTLLIGEPGIGKSRLLSEIETKIYGRGYESERSRPFGPWLEALRDYPAALELLRPEHAQKGRDQIFDPLVDWLRGQAGGWLVMDDLQWFDESSLALLHYALRVLAGHPLRWAAASRPLESDGNPALREFLRGLRRNRQLQEIPLQPLDGQTTARLVAWAAPEACADAARRSGGNPLYALELARSDGQGLEASVRDRLEEISGIAREIVHWAAALGRSFAPALLERLLGRGLFELLPALEELESHRIFVPLEQGYDFAHDVVRELTYRQLTAPRRRLIHLQIARTLHNDPDSWADLARHASLAQAHELAAPAALTAATSSLRVLAFSEASAYARDGLQHARQMPSHPASWQIQARLLQAELLAGLSVERRPAFAQEIQQLLELGQDQAEVAGTVYEVLAELAFFAHNDAQVEEYSRRLAEAADRSPAAEGARWLAHSGSCLASIGKDMHKAAALLGEAEELARRCHLQLVDIPLGWGLVEHHQGRWTEARARLLQALELTRRLGEPWWRAECIKALARLHLDLEEFDELAQLATELEEVVPRLGEGAEAGFAQALRALQEQSRSDGASQVVEGALTSLRRADARRLLSFVCRRAASSALKWGQWEQASQWAQQGFAAAAELQLIEEMALCKITLCETHFQAGRRRQGQEELRLLRREVRDRPIGALARQALERLRTRWGGQVNGTGDGRVGVYAPAVPGQIPEPN